MAAPARSCPAHFETMKALTATAIIALFCASCATHDTIRVTARSRDLSVAKERARAEYDREVSRHAQEGSQNLDAAAVSESVERRYVKCRRPSFGTTMTGVHIPYYFVTLESTAASK